MGLMPPTHLSAGAPPASVCCSRGVVELLAGQSRDATWGQARVCAIRQPSWRRAQYGEYQRKAGQPRMVFGMGPGQNLICRPKGLMGRGFMADAGLVSDESDGVSIPVGGLKAPWAGPTVLDWEADGSSKGTIGLESGGGIDAGLCPPAEAIGKGAPSAMSSVTYQSRSLLMWSALAREARKDWGVLRSDFASGVYPGWFFTAAAFLHAGAVDAAVLAGSIVYFTMYLFQFCIVNQLLGVSEDKVNKPFRPLASGEMTISGGWVRYAISMVAFATLGQALGVLPETLMWQASSFVHNALGGHKHYLSRGFNITVGVYAQLAAAWGMVLPISPVVWRWIWATALVSFLWSNIQDLRDVEGDMPTGRRTMPIAYGLTFSCRALAAVVAISGPMLHYYLVAPLTATIGTWIFQAVGNALCWLIAARMLLDETPAALQVTYTYYIHHYGWLLLGAFLLPPAAALA